MLQFIPGQGYVDIQNSGTTLIPGYGYIDATLQSTTKLNATYLPGYGYVDIEFNGTKLIPGVGYIEGTPPPSKTSYIPDATYLQEPNLTIPGRKPIGPVEIDWSHPLAKGLVSFSMPNEAAEISKNLVQHVNSVEAVSVGALNCIGAKQEDYRGLGIDPAASIADASCINTSNHGVTDSDDITVLAGIVVNSLASDQGLFDFTNDQQSGSWLDQSGGVLRLSAFTLYDTTSPITSTGYWIGGLSWTSAGGVRFYHNGKFSTSGTKTRATGIGATNTMSAWGTTQTAGKGFTLASGNMPVVHAAWKRKLTDEEVEIFCRDPYAFLKPAANTYPYLYAISSSSTTQSVLQNVVTPMDNFSVSTAVSNTNLLTNKVLAADAANVTTAVSDINLLTNKVLAADALSLSTTVSEANLTKVVQSSVAYLTDIRQPNVPGVKPIGPVEIDWSHPLARGLVNGFLFDEVGTIHNITGGEYTLNAGALPAYRSLDGKRLLSVAGNRYDVEGFTRFNYTKVCAFSIDTTSPNHNLMSGSQHVLWVTGDKLSAGHNGAWTTLQDSVSLPINEYTHAAVTYDNASSGALALYKNGNQLANTTGILEAASSDLLLLSYTAPGHELDGLIDYAYTYNRALSPQEIKLLHQNPYAFLKPANQTPYLYGVSTTSNTLTNVIMPADSLAVQTTISDVNLLKGSALLANTGSVAAFGASTNLLTSVVVQSDPAAIQYTGYNTNLLTNVVLASDPGSISIVGSNTNNLIDKVLLADAGTTSAIGVSTNLQNHKSLLADSWNITTAGASTNLLSTGALLADTGNLASQVRDVNLVRHKVLSSDATGIATVFNDINTLTDLIITATSAQYTVTAASINTLVNRVLLADTTTITINGSTASLVSGNVLPADATSVSVTGADANILKSTVLQTNAGNYTANILSANLLLGRVANGYAGQVTVTGSSVIFKNGSVISANAGALSTNTQDANLLLDAVLQAQTGSFSTTFVDSALGTSSGFTAATGSFSVTGTSATLSVATPLYADTGAFQVGSLGASLVPPNPTLPIIWSTEPNVVINNVSQTTVKVQSDTNIVTVTAPKSTSGSLLSETLPFIDTGIGTIKSTYNNMMYEKLSIGDSIYVYWAIPPNLDNTKGIYLRLANFSESVNVSTYVKYQLDITADKDIDYSGSILTNNTRISDIAYDSTVCSTLIPNTNYLEADTLALYIRATRVSADISDLTGDVGIVGVSVQYYST